MLKGRVLLVCDHHAREYRPLFRGAAQRARQGFADPLHLSAGAGCEGEALDHRRRRCDVIKNRVKRQPDSLSGRSQAMGGQTP